MIKTILGALMQSFSAILMRMCCACFGFMLLSCGDPVMNDEDSLGQVQQRVYEFERFENGPVSTGSFVTLNAGSTALPGWTISRGGVDYISTFWQSAEGQRSIDLNALSPGSISACVLGKPGEFYTISFRMAGNTEAPPAVKRMSVEANGYYQEYEFDTTGRSTTAMGWTQYFFTYRASALTTTLTFSSLTNGTGGPALDYVGPFDITPDCGICGDGVCGPNEDAGSCAFDCTVCGDGVCGADESQWSCRNDCGFCGDFYCASSEDRFSCPDDCCTSPNGC